MSKQPGWMDRERSLKARPVRLPVIATRVTDDQRLLVTVIRHPPRWVQWLGGRRESEHTFRLDGPGREVYNACDGKRDVYRIIKDFAKAHHISEVEAEMSVTAFLKTLVGKGLVAVEIDREEPRA